MNRRRFSVNNSGFSGKYRIVENLFVVAQPPSHPASKFMD
jgi:hypothetical protein